MFLLPCCILGIDKNRTFISTMQPQTTHFCLYIYSIDLIQFLVYCTQVWPIIRNFPFAVFFTIHCFTNFSIPLLVVFRAEVCKKTHLRRQASGKSPGRVRDYVVFWLWLWTLNITFIQWSLIYLDWTIVTIGYSCTSLIWRMRGSTNVVNYSELRYLLVVYGLACAVSLFRFDACRVLPRWGVSCAVSFGRISSEDVWTRWSWMAINCVNPDFLPGKSCQVPLPGVYDGIRNNCASLLPWGWANIQPNDQMGVSINWV